MLFSIQYYCFEPLSAGFMTMVRLGFIRSYTGRWNPSHHMYPHSNEGDSTYSPRWSRDGKGMKTMRSWVITTMFALLSILLTIIILFSFQR